MDSFCVCNLKLKKACLFESAHNVDEQGTATNVLETPY